jgi:peptidoglycan-associated lipoprotein
MIRTSRNKNQGGKISMINKNYAAVTAGLLLAGGLVACSSTDTSKATAAPGSAQTQTAAKPSTGVRQAQSQSSLDALRRGDSTATPGDIAMKEIFFEFDHYDLSTDARSTLKATADWLKKNAAVKVELEGHCDDRGTNEYNLALGAKRAQTAKDYLVTLGVGAGRLSTTSYGEEIPVCREHSEGCWQKNRRDRFITVNAKPGV